MELINKYLPLIKKNMPKISKWFIISILSVIFSIVLPYIVGKYLDVIVEKRTTDIYLYTLSFLIVAIISVILMYIENMIYVKLSNIIIYQLKLKVFSNIYEIPINNLNQFEPSYITRKVDMDSNTLVNFIFHFFSSVFINIFKLFIIIGIIYKINSKILFIILITLPIYILIYYLFKKPLYEKGYLFREKNNEFFSTQNEQMKLMKTLKMNCIYKYFKDRLDKKFHEFFLTLVGYYKTNTIYSSISSLAKNFSLVLLLFYGGFEIIKGRLSIGEFTIINNYYGSLIGIVLTWLEFGKTYQEAKVADSRISYYFNEKKDVNGNIKLNEINSIVIKDIKVGYDDKNFLFEIPYYEFKKGKIYNIVGDNGTGKSTFIDIIIGLNQRYQGEILFNNIKIKQLDMYYIRKKKLGIVDQFPVIFKDTIEKNIVFDEISYISRIKDFSKDILDSFFIEKHLNYTNKSSNKELVNMSGGEKQKLGIIRAMIKRPGILILDEPTASLDEQSILRIKKYLNQIKKDKIIIIVSHDRSIQVISDEIIDFNYYCLSITSNNID
ncbi:ABC transporter ATP-binding protein [Clostridium sp. D2Q-14]|uniref:ABC transporter transmembrane domain-containing protein n=1 Tax=Anaeromonas gelatinilytica TaxID=2683194 RepID=UPI00193B30FE|nr:ABC transporter ATP-binding protein [Anaeromonas gelatinilytica]MBS4534521.1 ABC transporter ATP-binding protein [Anaeromonas gelatinilytica]